MAQAWEYLHIETDYTRKITETNGIKPDKVSGKKPEPTYIYEQVQILGAEGWEVIAVVSNAALGLLYVLKRPRPMLGQE